MPHQCTGCGHTFADGSKEMLSGCPECGGNKFQFSPSAADLPDEPADPPEADAPERPEADHSSVAETVGRATTRMRDIVSSGPADPIEDAGDSSGESTTERGPSPGSAPGPDPNASWPSQADGESGSAGRETGEGASVDDGQASVDDGDATGDDGEIIDADARRAAVEDSDEDVAQASARTDVVPEEELPASDEAATETISGASGLESAEATAARAGPEPDVDGRVVSEPDDAEPDIEELREQLNDQFESIKIVEPGQYELNLMELYDREEYIIALQENGRYVIQVPEQWMGEEPGER